MRGPVSLTRAGTSRHAGTAHGHMADSRTNPSDSAQPPAETPACATSD